MKKDKKHLKDWVKLLDTEEVKKNLIKVSLYLFSYELLRNSVVDKIRDFYIIGFDGTNDIISKDYNNKVANRKIDGKQNLFLSSLYWLNENGVISAEEIEEIKLIREFRNDVAHRTDRILADSELNFDLNQEKRIFELIKKIELWWIKEVEISTNPDFDNKEISYDGIVSGKEIFYTYIKSISDDLLEGNNEKNQK
jgi:hypothetical protein